MNGLPVLSAPLQFGQAMRACARPGLAWLLCVLFSVTAWASGGGGNVNSGGNADSTNASSSAGDEVTSLPLTEASGLTFVGPLPAIRSIVVNIQGRGQVSFARITRELVAITLTGDYQVELDRAALQRANVVILFRGGTAFQGGLARLVVANSAPVLLAPDRVQLPIARLAGVRLQGTQLTLDAMGTRAQRAHIEASFSTDRVTLTQREL